MGRCGGWTLFGIAAVDPYRGASSGLACFDITPAVADQVTGGKIQTVFRGSLKQQSWLWLPAVAGILVVVVADKEVVQGKRIAQFLVQDLDYAALLGSPGDVGLIRNHQEEKSASFQCFQRSWNIRQDFQFLEAGRRERLAAAHDRAIQNAVAVQEDGFQRTDSHLVWVRLISGWETIRCHTTA